MANSPSIIETLEDSLRSMRNAKENKVSSRIWIAHVAACHELIAAYKLTLLADEVVAE